jgi:hypothetical protein
MNELSSLDIHEWTRRQDGREVLTHFVGLENWPSHRLAEIGHPRNRLIALVPQDTEATAVNQYPMDFLQRDGRVEPMKRLRDNDAVDRRILKGYFDVTTVKDLYRWESLSQYLAHAGRRINRSDVRAKGNELSGKYSRARAQIENVCVLINAERVDQERYSVTGIVRASLLVALAIRETGRAVCMWVFGQVRHPRLRSITIYERSWALPAHSDGCPLFAYGRLSIAEWDINGNL